MIHKIPTSLTNNLHSTTAASRNKLSQSINFPIHSSFDKSVAPNQQPYNNKNNFNLKQYDSELSKKERDANRIDQRSKMT